MVVTPRNGELSQRARSAFKSRPLLRPDLYSAISCLLPGEGLGNNELLSYLYFDEGYFESQFELAREDAKDALKRGWEY
jgi:hypothetical protein